MSQNTNYVGKEFNHPQLKKVLVTSVVPGTRVMVNAEVIERGRGYNDTKGKYTGYKSATGWQRGENREFGTTHQVNINELKK